MTQQRIIPDVTISLKATGGGLRCTLSAGKVSQTVRAAVSPTALDECRSELHAALRRFRAPLGGDLRRLPWSVVSSAMAQLHEAGRVLQASIFGAEHIAVSEFLQKHLPGWRRGGTTGFRVPIIELSARPDLQLPLEFLPALDPSKPPAAATELDLQNLAMRFVGFAGAVYRTPTKLSPSVTLRAVPKMRMRFFENIDLDAARLERAFLQRASWIAFEGPSPDETLHDSSFVARLARHLWDGVGDDLTQDQVLHFACHCDTEARHSFDHALDLASRKPTFLEKIGMQVPHARIAAIRDLRQEFGSYAHRPATSPLVFLNACGTSKLTSVGAASFPMLFLELQAACIIGTETPIPDAFAAAFSEQFYLSLIRGRKSGEALFDARWALLRRFLNPLGILYTMFGAPDLYVSPSQPDAVSPAPLPQP